MLKLADVDYVNKRVTKPFNEVCHLFADPKVYHQKSAVLPTGDF